jgi:tRNA-uridine 2-sulfurtransferase
MDALPASPSAGSPPRVFVAMSGGVDSSVAALLLQRAGYLVTGITFKLFSNEDLGEDDDRPCCSLESVARARRVCDRLGVPHYTMFFVEAFRELVIERFIAEYAAGRTPNPCVLCNRHLKFDLFLAKALALGADYIATGHHARIAAGTGGGATALGGVQAPALQDGGATALGGVQAPALQDGGVTALGGVQAPALQDGMGFRLLAGRDQGKDQSYALCHLNQTTMPRVLLPVGELCKSGVRDLAREASLPPAEQPESQDICFVREGHYGEFLARHGLPEAPGPIITREGRVIGEHRGLHRYTVGQRRGLRLSGLAERHFVAEKRLADNTLVVAVLDDLRQEEVALQDVNWCDGPAGAWPAAWPAGLRAMLRYRARPVVAEVVADDPGDRRVSLRLHEPLVVAPGQYGVLYDAADGHVVAGGTICHAGN